MSTAASKEPDKGNEEVGPLSFYRKMLDKLDFSPQAEPPRAAFLADTKGLHLSAISALSGTFRLRDEYPIL